MKAHRVLRRRGSHIFSDNRLTHGGKVVSLMRRQPFTHQEDSWYSFLLEAEPITGLYCGWKDMVIWKKIHFIGNRTRDLPACSIVPQTIETINSEGIRKSSNGGGKSLLFQ
jgi:hypothetical protein